MIDSVSVSFSVIWVISVFYEFLIIFGFFGNLSDAFHIQFIFIVEVECILVHCVFLQSILSVGFNILDSLFFLDFGLISIEYYCNNRQNREDRYNVESTQRKLYLTNESTGDEWPYACDHANDSHEFQTVFLHEFVAEFGVECEPDSTAQSVAYWIQTQAEQDVLDVIVEQQVRQRKYVYEYRSYAAVLHSKIDVHPIGEVGEKYFDALGDELDLRKLFEVIAQLVQLDGHQQELCFTHNTKSHQKQDYGSEGQDIPPPVEFTQIHAHLACFDCFVEFVGVVVHKGHQDPYEKCQRDAQLVDCDHPDLLRDLGGHHGPHQKRDPLQNAQIGVYVLDVALVEHLRHLELPRVLELYGCQPEHEVGY